ncbi:hypothetical protein EVAR_90449_1 [Eumeta japonica]|uniref:RNase H type-1 domain-containing protein n=1 Tax=Eumeta variegata TaxID=151549 RepID=A0A4C1SKH1_EUMVA|nr:hypothetical protein EVAR_90449_1 [Eumeta japonica]
MNWQKSLPKRLMPTMITRKFPYPGKRNDQKLKPTPVQTQIFTGHTGIAEYLHRFKLLQSPSCECDADKIESVWHIILECPSPNTKPQENPKTKLQHCARRQRKECYVAQKQQESLGYEQGVALFMDENTERLGIGFEAHGKRAAFHLGLANLINGTVPVKEETFDSLEQLVIEGESCRMVRTRNKIVLLFTWTEDTPFIQASKVLHKLSESEQATPRVISIDSMSVGYEKGNVEDYLGSIAASEKHKILGTSCQGPRRNERLGASPKANPLKGDKNRAKELAREQRSETEDKEKPRHLKDNERFTKVSPKPTKADLGEVKPPVVMPVENPKAHEERLEFAALTIAIQDVTQTMCKTF